MAISECCTTAVVCCSADTPIPKVAALMRTHHVGAVVVVDKRGEDRVPLGVLTDRDIIVETIALELDAALFTAGDLMTSPAHCVQEDASLLDALRAMRSHQVRRLPVLTGAGTLFGIISSDDVINLIANELSLMTGVIVEQPVAEANTRRTV